MKQLTGRPAAGVEYMDNSYRLLDLTVYGRQERFEDSPVGWPKPPEGTDTMRADGRPLAQWPRLKAGFPDDLRVTPTEKRWVHGKTAIVTTGRTMTGAATIGRTH